MHIGLNAHLLSSQAGYRAAGIHSYIDQLLKHLPAAAPSDWTFTAFVGATTRASYDGIKLRQSYWDTESAIRRIIWEQLAQPFQLGEFDLYHALAFVAPLWLRAPMVVTVYDLTFIRYPAGLPAPRRLYLRLFTGLTCRRARRVLAISHSTAHDLTELLNVPTDKIDVATPGYDDALYQPLPVEQVAAFRQRKGLPERFWFFVGTLEPRKNLTTLLEAYAALPKSERLPLILAGGKGWLYDDIFAAVERYNLSSDVRFPGFLPAQELPLWYNSAEVFLYPSVFEGFGLPVLEAMACGTPVITANVSSLPEVAGNAGLCVAPHDRAAWTAALRMAYHDADWRRQAHQRGLEEARCYTWQATAAQTVASYERARNGVSMES
jgi:glycosyltransferase involved in cell wall biosynthesis